MAMLFANPYMKCAQCGGWVTGTVDQRGAAPVVPCMHQKGCSSACPSWGPVDGCTCPPDVASAHGQPEIKETRLALGVKP